MLADALFRMRAVFRRSTVERELDDEVRFHVEHAIEKYVSAGMRRDEAERRARLEFGGVEQIKEDCRDARGIALLETIGQDMRFGFRTMRRAPAVTATAIVTLSLSIGALASVATLGHTLLFRHLPIDAADRFVTVSATRGLVNAEGPVSYPDYVSFRDRARTVQLVAHYSTAPLFIVSNGQAREVNGAVVSANYFTLLGLVPSAGRFFGDAEDRVPDRDRVAVISPSFQRAWFGRGPAPIGRTLKVNGVDFTIVGVSPEGFTGVTTAPVEIYIPAMMLRVGYRWCADSLGPDCTTLDMIGKLADGRSIDDARAELATLLPDAWRTAKRGENSGVAIAALQGVPSWRRDPSVLQTVAAVAIVLVIVCCANLAGLLSAQSDARRHEFNLRRSLGASRGRIVGQLITESIMLAAIGGVAGLALSRAIVAALHALFYAADSEGHKLAYDFSLAPSVALVVFLIAIAVGCLFSMFPAIQMSKSSAEGWTERASTRWAPTRWLLAFQAAVAVALVAVAALLAVSASRTMTAGNFDVQRVVGLRLRPRLVKYTPAHAQQFQRQALRALESVPGVESVSLIGTGAALRGGIARVALPAWTTDQRLRVAFGDIAPRYFKTLGIPMVGGREFDDRDGPDSEMAAIVSDDLARRLWPDGDALSATIVVDRTPRRVVGIAGATRTHSRGEPELAVVYIPFWQNPAAVDARVCVRINGDASTVLPALARAVNAVDGDVPVGETIPLSVQVEGWSRAIRLTASLVSYAAVVAMLLAAIGLYGALAFAVSRRTKEIGIRMALGAARASVLRLIVRDGMRVIAAGAAVGLVLAVAGARMVDHLLFGSANGDWLLYAGAAALVLVAGAAASVIPARRAAAVQPLVALRHE